MVVGCGIAGAAAAHRLQRRGFEVTVLESEATIGGRTSTEVRNGFTVDLAATMLLSSYRRMVDLIAEEGWQGHFAPGCDRVGVERDGRVHLIRASKPQGALSTGLLSWRAKLSLITVVRDVLRHGKALDWENPVLAASVDYGTVRDYTDRRVRNAELRDYLVDPACRFLGLSDLSDISAVDFLFLAKNMGKTALFNSPGGIDTLVRLMTSEVKVETSATVSGVEESRDGVTVTWNSGGSSRRMTADACVLAVPAPAAVRIHPEMGDERMAILNSVEYAPALNVYFGVGRRPDQDAALILLPQRDFPDMACVILDHNKTEGRAPAGAGLISTYWQKEWALAHWHDPDEDIARHAAAEVHRLIPGAVDAPLTTVVKRWQHALITGPVSRYRDLERFRALTPARSRVRFAGDAMAASTMNSCLCSGERAADEVADEVVTLR